MKNIQLLFASLAFALLISACGSGSCSADDWAGTWVGSITDLNGVDQETIVTIRAIGDDMISFSQDDTDYGEIAVSGCAFSDSQMESTFLGDVFISLSAELSGDVITLDVNAELLGESIEQRAILTRQ